MNSNKIEESIKIAAERFNNAILEPILLLLVAGSILLFLWGFLIFLVNGNDGDRQKGKNHMFWGVVGLFIVFAAGGFVKIIQATIGDFSP